jgi:hypothetical protein
MICSFLSILLFWGPNYRKLTTSDFITFREKCGEHMQNRSQAAPPPKGQCEGSVLQDVTSCSMFDVFDASYCLHLQGQIMTQASIMHLIQKRI